MTQLSTFPNRLFVMTYYHWTEIPVQTCHQNVTVRELPQPHAVPSFVPCATRWLAGLLLSKATSEKMMGDLMGVQGEQGGSVKTVKVITIYLI